MSRYIKLEDALRVLTDSCYLDEIDENMQKLPSIDIVFCKECKHWSRAPKTERGWCDKCDGLLEPNFYCADGGRRE